MPVMLKPSAQGEQLQNSNNWVQKLAGKVATFSDPSGDVGDFDVSGGIDLPGPMGGLAKMLPALAIALTKRPIGKSMRQRALDTADRLFNPRKVPGSTHNLMQAGEELLTTKGPRVGEHVVQTTIPKNHSPSSVAQMAPRVRTDGNVAGPTSNGRLFNLSINDLMTDMDPELMMSLLGHEFTHGGQQLHLYDWIKRNLGQGPVSLDDATVRYLREHGGLNPNDEGIVRNIFAGQKGPRENLLATVYEAQNAMVGYPKNPFEIGANTTGFNILNRADDQYLPAFRQEARRQAGLDARKPNLVQGETNEKIINGLTNRVNKGRIDFVGPAQAYDAMEFLSTSPMTPATFEQAMRIQGQPARVADVITWYQQQRQMAQVLAALQGLVP